MATPIQLTFINAVTNLKINYKLIFIVKILSCFARREIIYSITRLLSTQTIFAHYFSACCIHQDRCTHFCVVKAMAV